ncbi:MAG: ankyrin repeat domain-containing protein [Acidobacteriia bacterium]|nr:ankyrin repeat domain-containing protein [Terriglobia bacterium]
MASFRCSALLLVCAALRANEPDGTTPLHYAVRNQDVPAVRSLLAKSVPADAQNRYGVTPLVLAVEAGNLEIVNALIAAGANVNHALPEGETVLMTAARTGNVPVIRALLRRDARVEARDQFYGETALIWAAAAGHADAVRALLDGGADVNGRSASASFAHRNAGLTRLSLGEWTPLMYTAREGALAAGRTLVEGRADVNAQDPDGATALVLAIINYHYDFAAMLLDAKADPNLADSTGMAALYAAVDMNSLPWMFGRPEIPAPSQVSALDLIERLLNHGANPNAALTKVQFQRAHTDGDPALGPGATPFLRAAKAADLSLMKLLLAHGADPNVRMEKGNTALMLAAGLGYRDGNMAVPTRDRGTPQEAIAAIQICLDQGADINTAGENGNTALHDSVTGRGDPEIIRYLAAHGASLTVKNSSGQTPLDVARSSRRDRIAAAKALEELAAHQ